MPAFYTIVPPSFTAESDIFVTVGLFTFTLRLDEKVNTGNRKACLCPKIKMILIPAPLKFTHEHTSQDELKLHAVAGVHALKSSFRGAARCVFLFPVLASCSARQAERWF